MNRQPIRHLLFTAAIGAAAAMNASAADPRRGQQLVGAHCGECHDNAIYGSAQRKAADRATVRQQIESGALALGLNWSAGDIADVEQYLNQAFYKF
jgi:mono/diheme cytochrome c family protein